ncbi:hypothetical protein Hanom_Chr12g01155631 [Helianthus anomalus]
MMCNFFFWKRVGYGGHCTTFPSKIVNILCHVIIEKSTNHNRPGNPVYNKLTTITILKFISHTVVSTMPNE